MRYSMILFVVATLLSQVYMAPQFISFKDGKLGVNFGGYHAGVGIGGLLGGNSGAGGLYAEAGTPTGQSARAGLGGNVDGKGGASGGLFADATAGGNVKAGAGLAGGVNGEKSAGGGYASAQAGNRFSSSGLAGESGLQGSYGATHTLEVKPIYKEVKTDVNINSVNEVKPVEFVPLNNAGSKVETKVEVKGEVQPPVIVKEVSRKWRPDNLFYHRPIYPNFNFQDVMNSMFEVQPHAGYNRRPWIPQRKPNRRIYKVYVAPQPHVVEKHIIHTHYKPHRHHFYKTAFVGGYIGNGGENAPSNVHQTESAIHKKVDVGAEANANARASVGVNGYGGVGHTYTKQVTYQQNPTFFEDIFNIPISTLKAVGNFLGNTAGNTNVSVQKSASIQAAETDSEPVKHVSSTTSSSNAHISVETPHTSTLFDDIFAIPISTLGAVNKFLENNVATRKNVEN